jgi:hypothetical protein
VSTRKAALNFERFTIVFALFAKKAEAAALFDQTLQGRVDRHSVYAALVVVLMKRGADWLLSPMRILDYILRDHAGARGASIERTKRVAHIRSRRVSLQLKGVEDDMVIGRLRCDSGEPRDRALPQPL